MARGDLNVRRGDTQPETREMAAARWLCDMARDFLNGRVGRESVNEAIAEWLASPDTGEKK